jgi:TatD DNase family protein
VLVDTHCHLDFAQFDEDRLAVIERARKAGVGAIVTPSIDVESSARVVALTHQFDGLYAAVGMHPNSATSWTGESAGKLREMAAERNVVALGEIGLDYYRDSAPPEAQRRVLEQQLALAAELELPVIIHNRESNEDVLRILLDWQAGLLRSGSALAGRPGVLHSFSGDKSMAEKAAAAGYFIGFTGPLTFKNAELTREIAASVRLENILIETDSPYLAPHPYRGQRNEPAYVKLVAEKLAEVKDISFDEVGSITTANAHRLFKFGERQ